MDEGHDFAGNETDKATPDLVIYKVCLFNLDWVKLATGYFK